MRVEETLDYREWINALRDRAGKAKIQVRVDRLVHENPGDHRNLPSGISELKIDFGPGYRVYYSQRGDRFSCCWQAETSLHSKKTSVGRSLWRRITRTRDGS